MGKEGKEEMNRYLSGRANETKKEMPLVLVESQSYIHYGKGAVNMFALQDYIGEDSVNAALRRFLGDWRAYGTAERYPSTADLVPYIRDVAPDSMQNVITDLFERIILFENKVDDAVAVENDAGYLVTLELNSRKLEADSLGTETVLEINDWIDVGVFGLDESGKEKLLYLEKHPIRKEQNTIEIQVSEKPTRAGIDPINKLIDRNPTDNTTSFSIETAG